MTRKNILFSLAFLGFCLSSTGLEAQPGAKKVSMQQRAYTGDITESTINSLVDNKLILVEGGTFEMGSEDYGAFPDEGPVHEVEVASFLISRYEITFAEYDMFCTHTNREQPDDQGWGRGSNPVINVNWYDAVEYCNWRSNYEGLEACYTIKEKNVICNWEANGYRLPTEAEWEYAAKGGKKSEYYIFSGSDNAHQVGWYWDNSSKRIHKVGEKRANELGLHDMTGNVWEWVWNAEYKYKKEDKALKDPTDPSEGRSRILRGGSWLNRAYGLRTSFRREDSPDYRFGDYGFRVVRREN